MRRAPRGVGRSGASLRDRLTGRTPGSEPGGRGSIPRPGSRRPDRGRLPPGGARLRRPLALLRTLQSGARANALFPLPPGTQRRVRTPRYRRRVAQQAERPSHKGEVAGSIPASPTHVAVAQRWSARLKPGAALVRSQPATSVTASELERQSVRFLPGKVQVRVLLEPLHAAAPPRLLHGTEEA